MNGYVPARSGRGSHIGSGGEPRPRTLDPLGQSSISVAAACGWGLARGHPYRDGNKRVAFLAMATFQELNGWVFGASEAEVVQVMLAVAAGQCGQAELADWIRSHAAPGRRR